MVTRYKKQSKIRAERTNNLYELKIKEDSLTIFQSFVGAWQTMKALRSTKCLFLKHAHPNSTVFLHFARYLPDLHSTSAPLSVINVTILRYDQIILTISWSNRAFSWPYRETISYHWSGQGTSWCCQYVDSEKFHKMRPLHEILEHFMMWANVWCGHDIYIYNINRR